MEGFRFTDLVRASEIGIYFAATGLTFSERFEDVEVSFSPEDGRTIAAMLAQIVGTDQVSADKPTILIHHFRNTDGDEDAAFSIEEWSGGVQMTLGSSTEARRHTEDPYLDGMKVCISLSDAKTLLDAFSGAIDASSSRDQEMQ